MARAIVRRIVFGLIAVFGVAVLTFILQFIVPGNPAQAIAPRAESFTVLHNIEKQLHLNQPLWQQFAYYFGNLLHGNLGTSYVDQQSVWSLIEPRLGATGLLALAGVVAEVIMGGIAGVLAVLYPRLRALINTVNLLLLSIPTFVLAVLALLFVGYGLHIGVFVNGGFGAGQLVLPALTLGLIGTPWYAQIVADQLEDSLASTYVRTAVAKGLSDRYILLRHVLRNVLSPAITMIGLDLGAYLSGVVVVEVVFGWPGIGALADQSLQILDRPTVLGTALLGAAAVVFFNLVADIARMFVDPRTREEV